MSSWTRCAGASTRGRASASTCNTCPNTCGRHRKRWIPTKSRAAGQLRRSSGGRLDRAEDLLELVRSRDLELIVPAVLRPLVRSPALEHRGVAKAIALHVVVFHFAHSFNTHRLPRQILARTPTALTARHAGSVIGIGPLAPRVSLERTLTKRRQLTRQLPAPCHGECRGHADVMQPAAVVVETKQQRSDELVFPVLVPAKAGNDTVRRARVLDLDHRALAGLIRAGDGLRDHTIESGALESGEPFDGEITVARDRCEMHRRLRAGQHAFELCATLALRGLTKVDTIGGQRVERHEGRGRLASQLRDT